MGSKNGIANF